MILPPPTQCQSGANDLALIRPLAELCGAGSAHSTVVAVVVTKLEHVQSNNQRQRKANKTISYSVKQGKELLTHPEVVSRYTG